jgi:L-amino acid N-acyltransferase
VKNETLSLDGAIHVREAMEDDLPFFLDIYNDAVLNLTASFDLEPQSLESRRKWFRSHGGKYPLLAAEVAGRAIGYSSISPYAEKPGYSKTVELSIYVHRDFRRRGVGRALMSEILSRAKILGYHSVISLISGDNEPSIELHRGLGFVQVGYMREVGYKFARWQDVTILELLL